jgi:hypothetical protein
MTLDKEHISFENHCKQLIGLTIIKVEYAEIAYDELSGKTNPEPYYTTHFPNLDSVDFSIFLHTDNDKLVEIYWDGKFFQYGIGIKINKPSDFLGHIKWNVSSNDLWKQFIGTAISDIHITWETVTTREVKTGKTERFVYPQDIKVSFSNNKNIFISASGFLNQGDKEVCGMLDNLTVTDNEELARQVKMIN